MMHRPAIHSNINPKFVDAFIAGQLSITRVVYYNAKSEVDAADGSGGYGSVENFWYANGIDLYSIRAETTATPAFRWIIKDGEELQIYLPSCPVKDDVSHVILMSGDDLITSHRFQDATAEQFTSPAICFKLLFTTDSHRNNPYAVVRTYFMHQGRVVA